MILRMSLIAHDSSVTESSYHRTLVTWQVKQIKISNHHTLTQWSFERIPNENFFQHQNIQNTVPPTSCLLITIHTQDGVIEPRRRPKSYCGRANIICRCLGQALLSQSFSFTADRLTPDSSFYDTLTKFETIVEM